MLNSGPVRILDNHTRARCSNADLCRDGLDAAIGDIRDVAALRRAMTGCDTVFHLAAKATVMECEENPGDAFP